MAEISVFIANNHTNNLTVNETDPVTLKCTAVGRPTPAMRIVKNGRRVADRPRSQVSPDDTATLVHMVSRAECSEAGCQLLDNDNPAGHEELTDNLTVNETDPVTLKCTAVGRPTPAMRIVKNGRRVADRPRSQVSPDDTATLVHRVSRAECSEAGRYGCQLLDNDNPAGHEEYSHSSGQL